MKLDSKLGLTATITTLLVSSLGCGDRVASVTNSPSMDQQPLHGRILDVDKSTFPITNNQGEVNNLFYQTLSVKDLTGKVIDLSFVCYPLHAGDSLVGIYQPNAGDSFEYFTNKYLPGWQPVTNQEIDVDGHLTGFSP